MNQNVKRPCRGIVFARCRCRRGCESSRRPLYNFWFTSHVIVYGVVFSGPLAQVWNFHSSLTLFVWTFEFSVVWFCPELECPKHFKIEVRRFPQIFLYSRLKCLFVAVYMTGLMVRLSRQSGFPARGINVIHDTDRKPVKRESDHRRCYSKQNCFSPTQMLNLFRKLTGKWFFRYLSPRNLNLFEQTCCRISHGARTSLRSVRTPWPRAKYFPIRPSQLVNTYIIFALVLMRICTLERLN